VHAAMATRWVDRTYVPTGNLLGGEKSTFMMRHGKLLVAHATKLDRVLSRRVTPSCLPFLSLLGATRAGVAVVGWCQVLV
jgi:hypothetical protein